LKGDNLAAVYVSSLQEPADVNFNCFVLRGMDVSPAAIEGVVDPLGHESVGRPLIQRHSVCGLGAIVREQA
jgi:hypothetical protein